MNWVLIIMWQHKQSTCYYEMISSVQVTHGIKSETKMNANQIIVASTNSIVLNFILVTWLQVVNLGNFLFKIKAYMIS